MDGKKMSLYKFTYISLLKNDTQLKQKTDKQAKKKRKKEKKEKKEAITQIY